jgi:hypothetical protein
MRKAIIIVAATALAAILGSCGADSDDEGGKDTYTVSGHLIKSDVADGTFGYGKLVAGPNGAQTDTILYSAKSTAFSGGSASFSIPDIEAGDYTCFAFIDVDGNASASAPEPDSEDWVTNGGEDISVSNDFAKDVPEDAWVLEPPSAPPIPTP